MKVDDFIAALASNDGATQVHAGDTVYGSDNMKIGEVEGVAAASNGTGGHLVVSKGIVFEKHAYVPLSAVVKRAGTSVYINVPKMVAGKMPWDAPPTAEAQRDKYGPAMADVGQLYGSASPTGSPGLSRNAP